MSYSYPIYTKVTACNYKSDKSFGSVDTSEQQIMVGSSISNSYELAKVVTTKRKAHHEKYGWVMVFKYSVDGIVLKESMFKDNNGRAGEHIKTRSALGRMKGLK